MAQYIESLDFPPAAEQAVEAAPEKPEMSWVDDEVEVSVATYQAYQILYYTFIGLMSVAGIDKILHISATWESYVSPAIASLLHMSPGAISFVAGLIEIGAAATVALRPRIGSWVVTVWLSLIVVNLLTASSHFDMAVAGLTLVAAGFAFTRLSAECN
jgi:hypothetical protein